MLFNSYITEGDDNTAAVANDEVDSLVAADLDPDSTEGIEAMAAEVENHMTTTALEAVSYFEGGEEAIQHFTESADVQALVEARKMPKRTFVRLNKSDDLQRRSNLACLVLAKAHKDPLWTKLAQNRVKERKLRNAIYVKYRNKANMVARKSQLQHQKIARNLPSLPKVQY